MVYPIGSLLFASGDCLCQPPRLALADRTPSRPPMQRVKHGGEGPSRRTSTGVDSRGDGSTSHRVSDRGKLRCLREGGGQDSRRDPSDLPSQLVFDQTNERPTQKPTHTDVADQGRPSLPPGRTGCPGAARTWVGKSWWNTVARVGKSHFVISGNPDRLARFPPVVPALTDGRDTR